MTALLLLLLLLLLSLLFASLVWNCSGYCTQTAAKPGMSVWFLPCLMSVREGHLNGEDLSFSTWTHHVTRLGFFAWWSDLSQTIPDSRGGEIHSISQCKGCQECVAVTSTLRCLYSKWCLLPLLFFFPFFSSKHVIYTLSSVNTEIS